MIQCVVIGCHQTQHKKNICRYHQRSKELLYRKCAGCGATISIGYKNKQYCENCNNIKHRHSATRIYNKKRKFHRIGLVNKIIILLKVKKLTMQQLAEIFGTTKDSIRTMLYHVRKIVPLKRYPINKRKEYVYYVD